MAFAPLDSVDWGVVLRQSQEEVLEPTRRLQQQVLGLGGFSLLIALLAVWFTTRSVLGPIRVLTSSARRLADGKLDQPVSVHASGEVAQLASTLEYMRDRLRASMEQIQQYNTELDTPGSRAHG